MLPSERQTRLKLIVSREHHTTVAGSRLHRLGPLFRTSAVVTLIVGQILVASAVFACENDRRVHVTCCCPERSSATQGDTQCVGCCSIENAQADASRSDAFALSRPQNAGSLVAAVLVPAPIEFSPRFAPHVTSPSTPAHPAQPIYLSNCSYRL